MNCSDLETARTTWLMEKAQYIVYCANLKQELEAIFLAASIPVTISYRVKADDSLLKKMLYKNTPYSEINDKVGVRGVVHFLSDLSASDGLIQREFGERIRKRENKLETCDDKTFGYLSIHYDISSKKAEAKPLICELQLRTICQNAWSELAHILSYKPETELPKDIKREVNALSALMEIADNQFQFILDMINELPVTNPTRILRTLDGFFYSHIGAWYDSEMSRYFLDDIARIYSQDENIINILYIFLEQKGDEIARVAKDRKDILFFSQPEIVLILERLEKKPLMLEEYWEGKYPIEQLEAVANAWGISIN